MKTDKAYYVGLSLHSYRSGEPAEIIGVEIITPENGRPRPCYHIRYSDKTEDHVVIDDAQSGKVIGFQDILNQKIPNVTETPEKKRVNKALMHAVDAIHFNDSSDYLKALYSVVQALTGIETVTDQDIKKLFKI